MTGKGKANGARRRRRVVTEAQRKAIHFAFLLLPLQILHGWLPWPVARSEWRLLLVGAVLVAMAIDLARIHDRRFRRFFGEFFGQMIREHERFNLLGSTYLLLASLLVLEVCTPAVAAGAIGFTVLGDGVAGLAGRAWGRRRLFGKTLEGTLAGLAACLVWAAWLVLTGHLTWEVAVVGALVASLVEMLPIPLDDNLGVTLFAGYAMKLMGG